MTKQTLNEQDFKELVKTACDNTQWSDYCRNAFTFDEWTSMSITERKASFEEYIDEADLEEIIDQEYWEGVFVSTPEIVNDSVCGVLEE